MWGEFDLDRSQRDELRPARVRLRVELEFASSQAVGDRPSAAPEPSRRFDVLHGSLVQRSHAIEFTAHRRYGIVAEVVLPVGTSIVTEPYVEQQLSSLVVGEAEVGRNGVERLPVKVGASRCAWTAVADAR